MEESLIREFFEHEICVRLHTGFLFIQFWRILVLSPSEWWIRSSREHGT